MNTFKNGTIYHGDCLKIMEQLPDKSIDMVLCDPPYGTTPYEWDKTLDFKFMWDLYHKKVKPSAAILLFGHEPFSSFLRISNLKEFKYDWYWQKERLTNVFQLKKRPGKNVEVISVFYKKQCIYNPQKTIHTGKRVSNKIKDGGFSQSISGGNSKIKPIEYKLKI